MESTSTKTPSPFTFKTQTTIGTSLASTHRILLIFIFFMLLFYGHLAPPPSSSIDFVNQFLRLCIVVSVCEDDIVGNCQRIVTMKLNWSWLSSSSSPSSHIGVRINPKKLIKLVFALGLRKSIGIPHSLNLESHFFRK